MRSGGAEAERFREVWRGRAPLNSNRRITAASICALSPSHILFTLIGGMDPKA